MRSEKQGAGRQGGAGAIPPALFLLFGLWMLTACAGGPAGYPLGYMERGIASWYGPGFHGNRTANGERYDMYRLTAAHRTLPLGSVAEVRSLTNGQTVTVRINDRGPFAKGRIIDLSLAAAKELGMTGAGTDRVELRVIGYQGRPGAFGSLRVQVASFEELANAQALAGRLRGRYQAVRIVAVDLPSGKYYRVQVGQFASERQAEAVAQRLESELDVETLVMRDAA